MNFDLFNFLPKDQKNIILEMIYEEIIYNLVNTEIFLNQDIINKKNDLLNISLLCKEFYILFKSNKSFIKINQIHNLYNKYNNLNLDYCKIGCGWTIDAFKSEVPKGNPQLLSLISSPFHILNEKELNDLKEIINIFPKSIYCNIGRMRCREFITPLIMSCFNNSISIDIIELMLKNGSDPNSFILLNAKKIHLLTDLRDNDKARYELLKPLLEKYGAKEQIFKYDY